MLESAPPELVEDVQLASTQVKVAEQALLVALDELPPAQREVLALVYFERAPVRQVAMRLGSTEEGDKALQLRALRHLRQLLHLDRRSTASPALEIARDVIARRRALLARLAR